MYSTILIKTLKKIFHQLNKFSSKILPLYLLFITFNSCEVNENIIEEDNKMSTEKISKEQLLSELNNQALKEFVVNNNYSESNTKLLKTQNYSDFFEKIVKPNEYVTYSLRLNSYSNNTPYFKYFIINKDVSGIEKAGFVKYIPLISTYSLDVDNFTGDIEIYTVENELFAKTTFQNGTPVTNNLSKDNNNTVFGCYNTSYIIVHPCSHGGGHLPGETCNNGLINDAYYEIRTTVVCIDSNVKYIAPPDEFGGVGGGGGGATLLNVLNIPEPYEGEPSFDNPSYMEYRQILDFLKANSVYNNLLNHNYANANLLNDWLVPAVVDYFRNNEFNQQTQINVINTLSLFNQILPLEHNNANFEQMLSHKVNAFKYLLTNPTPEGVNFAIDAINLSIDLEIDAFDVWNDYELFRDQMSNDERNIFDNMLINRRLMYIVAAKKAIEETSERYSNTAKNGTGDAFRHALWNGMSSLLIGQSLTEQLTTAHETRPSDYTYTYKEKEMDLYNNLKGRQIANYSNIFSITDNVVDHLQIGGLRYLNNLDSNFLATYNSILVPTN